MMGPSHVIFASLCGAQFGVIQGSTPAQTLLFAGAATLFSAGRQSPDIDNYRTWKKVDAVVPDEVLGRGGPLQHRGLIHWWGLWGGGWWQVTSMLPAGLFLWQLVTALFLGPGSHLVGDFLFGKGGYGRGPGIPLFPWWGHVGLGLKAGGKVEPVFLLGCAVGFAAQFFVSM